MDVKRKDMALLSNSIAAYAHIKANPESFGLPAPPTAAAAASAPPEKKRLKSFGDEEEEDFSEEDEEEEEDEAEAPVSPVTEVPVGNHSQSDGALSVNVFTSAEELERAQRLEERERIIREIWRNGQPDILGSGTGTIGRVHYY
ncbi:hypothetical protein ANANG_G00025640 [Anguilla anguilla]|uniref:EVA1 domain-containing protein n=1 Tax=Anguilla anguilla TaxID=7936 RepID=A0A9D3N166_ANGAN|nr:hypothetical protein ANANG_G00025640 [Anguilla anguilla]